MSNSQLIALLTYNMLCEIWRDLGVATACKMSVYCVTL